MQVKGHSAIGLKWKVVTLLVSLLCGLFEETKGQVRCSYEVIPDHSVDDNYRVDEQFLNSEEECQQLCSSSTQCTVVVYQSGACRVYEETFLTPQSDGGWIYMKKLNCSSADATTQVATTTTLTTTTTETPTTTTTEPPTTTTATTTEPPTTTTTTTTATTTATTVQTTSTAAPTTTTASTSTTSSDSTDSELTGIIVGVVVGMVVLNVISVAAAVFITKKKLKDIAYSKPMRMQNQHVYVDLNNTPTGHHGHDGGLNGIQNPRMPDDETASTYETIK